MKSKPFLSVYMIAFLLVALLGLMVVFPAESLRASLKGLAIWWDVLFPALFPFFVISEMMLGVGIVHFFGTLLDPLMRPIFRIPGIGGFVMAMGFAAGYPVAAKLTSQLWDQGLVNREEGERLVSFTTTSDPIFLIGAVSVGFFHDASLAVVLAAAHYGSAVVLGLFMRFHGAKPSHAQAAANTAASPGTPSANLFVRAFNTMHDARMRDGRGLGEMLLQGIKSALQLNMVVGGLVVFFSVVMEVMTSAHIMNFCYIGINAILHLFGMPESLSQAVTNGIFEVTLGSKAAGGAGEHIPLLYKTAIAAWVLSWAGLSVHAQIVSLLQHTSLRYWPFLAARFAHGILAAIAVFLLWEPLASSRSAWAPYLPEMDVTAPLADWWRLTLPWGFTVLGAVLAGLAALAVLYSFFKRCMKRLV